MALRQDENKDQERGKWVSRWLNSRKDKNLEAEEEPLYSRTESWVLKRDLGHNCLVVATGKGSPRVPAFFLKSLEIAQEDLPSVHRAMLLVRISGQQYHLGVTLWGTLKPLGL
jgi:hypothetical protein